jgi:SPP1 gp7 family putative phage head morphogenesis protein
VGGGTRSDHGVTVPVETCTASGRSGFRWGEQGKCYTYTPGNKVSRARARTRARTQGRAIQASGSKAFDDILNDRALWEALRENYMRVMVPIWREGYLGGALAATEERPVRDSDTKGAAALAGTLVGLKRLPFDPLDTLQAFDLFVDGYSNPAWLNYAASTRDALELLVQRAARNKWTVTQMIEGLDPIFSPERAHRIAATELTNVMGEGATQTYDEAGFPEWEWRTVRDSFVCPICKPRNEKRFPISIPFRSAHPHCRCWPVPAGPQFGTGELDPGIDPTAPGGKKGTSTATLHQTASGNWTAERTRLHDSIIDDALRGVTPSSDPTVYMMGGGAASGKSSVIKSKAMDDVLPRNRVDIDPDKIKTKLPEYNTMLDAGDVRAAGFTHTESSYISQRMMDEATALKLDVLLDGTGDKSLEILTERVNRYRAQGHKVIANYVTVPTNKAVSRAKARALDTGREVSEDVIREAHEEISRVLPQAMDDGLFDELTVWNTDIPIDAEPILIFNHVDGGATTIHNQGLWDEFLAKANP